MEWNVNTYIAVLLIFLIIFTEKIEILHNKYVYYIISIIFILILTLISFNNLDINKGIIMLLSVLYIMIWNIHNLDIIA